MNNYFITFLSNFHLGDEDDGQNILKLYHKSVYGNADFNRFRRTFDYGVKHPLNGDIMFVVFYSLSSAILVNSKIEYQLETGNVFSTPYKYLFQEKIKIISL